MSFLEHQTYPSESRLIEDLGWVASSPGLLSGARYPMVEDGEIEIPRELQLDRLRELFTLRPRSYKLGIRAECLLEHAISLSSGFLLEASHLSVFRPGPRGEKLNVGEYDFLVRNRSSGELEHWELAVKFFLLARDSPDPERVIEPFDFIGPNGKDSLGNKLQKILHRQLQLSRTPAGRAALESAGFLSEGGQLRSRLISRGRLFYPWRSKFSDFDVPFISAQSLRGVWVRASEFRHWVGDFETRSSNPGYALLRRPWWMASVSSQTCPELLLNHGLAIVEAVESSFGVTPGALLIAGLQRTASAGWIERERVFVVHDQWPAPVDSPGA